MDTRRIDLTRDPNAGRARHQRLRIAPRDASGRCRQRPRVRQAPSSMPPRRGRPSPDVYGSSSSTRRHHHHGIWAEMLDDRKFFEPITSSRRPPPSPRPLRPAARGRPSGPTTVCSWTRSTPMPAITPPREARRARHGGSASRAVAVRGKSYVGRIVLAGDPGAQVTVSLVWGSGTGAAAGDREADSAYATLPLPSSGRPTATTASRITGTGPGAFRIGAVSLMPADNSTASVRRSSPPSSPCVRVSIASRAATSSRPTTGATPSAIRTGARRPWTPSGTPCSPTTSAPTSS